MDQIVTLFNGDKVRVTCEDSKIISVLTKVMLDPFNEDMKAAWLSNDQSEAKAKRYMNYVGSLMIKNPQEHNIKSDRALARITEKEICVADVNSPPVKDKKEKKVKPKKYTESRFEKIEKIKKANPGCKMISIRVDTDGKFSHDGIEYKIVDENYKSKPTKGYGDYYKFDTVYVIKNVDLKFYDQDLKQIETSKIKLG